MKITGMSRDELFDPKSLWVDSSESDLMSHPKTEVRDRNDYYRIVSGGFRVEWHGEGNLATASYTLGYEGGTKTWIATSKDHGVSSPARIKAWAIGLASDLLVDGVSYTVKVTSGRDVSWPPSSHPSALAELGEGYVLTGGGAEVVYKGYGNLLWKLEPTTEMDRQWFSAASKDHVKPDECQIYVYSYGIKLEKTEPPEWPLGVGPFKAGFRLVSDIPISSKVGFRSSRNFDRPAKNKAIIFYPATVAGENASLATGFYRLIVFGHAKRFLASFSPVCPGTPKDITQDFRQFSGVFAHMSTWGFIIISPDLSWMTEDAMAYADEPAVLNDALSYMVEENLRVGSPFNGKILTGKFGAIGHSTGALATIYKATSTITTLPIDAMALIAPAATSSTDISQIEKFSPNPVMIIHGTDDMGTYGAGDGPLSIYKSAKAKKYLIKIEGANHFGYTDSLCLESPGDSAAIITQADQQRIAKAYLTAFFLRHMKGVTALDDYLAGIRPIEELEHLKIWIEHEF